MRREEATRFLRLFERPNCVLLLLMSTGSTTGGEKGARRRERQRKEKKTGKHIAIAARRAAVSIAREARLVSNLTPEEESEGN